MSNKEKKLKSNLVDINIKISNLGRRNVKDKFYRELDLKMDREYMKETGTGEYLYMQRPTGTSIALWDEIPDCIGMALALMNQFPKIAVYNLSVTEFDGNGTPYGTVKRLKNDDVYKKLKRIQKEQNHLS